MIISTRALEAHIGATVALRGWLLSKQVRGKLAFLGLRDGEGVAQLVCEARSLPEDIFASLGSLGLETPLEVEGRVVLPQGRRGPSLRSPPCGLLPATRTIP